MSYLEGVEIFQSEIKRKIIDFLQIAKKSNALSDLAPETSRFLEHISLDHEALDDQILSSFRNFLIEKEAQRTEQISPMQRACFLDLIPSINDLRAALSLYRSEINDISPSGSTS